MNMGAWNVPAERLLLAIGQVSLTTALVILPLLALRKLLRRRYPARVLCLVWAVLVVRLLVPVQFSLPRAPVQVTPHLTQVRYAEKVELPDGQFEMVPRGREWVETAEVHEVQDGVGMVCLSAILFTIWAVAALLLLGWQLEAYWVYSQKLRRTAREVTSPGLLAVYRAECGRLGVRRNIPLMQSPLADSPMLAGLLRPVLLLPAEPLPEEAAPLVLRHELTHYQRHDLWLKLAATAAKCMHWFNPVVYPMLRALYEDIEIACDSRVVEGLDSEERRRYGMAILECAASQSAARQPLTTCFTSGKESMKTRLGELFVTGAKKRGVALLLICALTVGIVGGAVSVGSTEGPAKPEMAADAALTGEILTEEAAGILAGAWADGWLGRDMETAMPYLTRSFQRTVFDSMYDPKAEDGTAFSFDPDSPHYGVPAESRRWFWNVGVSSPWIHSRTVLPDLENSGAYVVYGWWASGTPEVRSMEYVHFTREDGAWRVSSVDGSLDKYGGPFYDVLDSAGQFRLLYGNDLGLPDFLIYVEFAAAQKEQGSRDTYFDLSDPVTAAEKLFGFEGGSGEVTGQVAVTSEGLENQSGASSHVLGCIVTYTFDDGSTVDLVMSSQYGESYIPVDWRIDGKNTRTMVDLASQWAYGTMYKDTHLMFPLLTAAGTEELIAVQQNYSGTEGDEWYWKHGKYGSSPTAQEYGVFLDLGDGTARVTYGLGSSGDYLYRESELLRFVDTPAGLKIDSVCELTHSEELLRDIDGLGLSAAYELVERSDQEWFAMQYIAEPVAGALNQYPGSLGNGPALGNHRAYMDDPVEAVKAMLYINEKDSRPPYDETCADVVLVSGDDTDALVRLDFAGGGSAYVTLGYSTGWQRWRVNAIRDADASQGLIRSAEEFREVYGEGSNYLWRDACQTQGFQSVAEAEAYFRLDRSAMLDTRQTEVEYTSYRTGIRYEAKFPDGWLQISLARRDNGRLYPVEWLIDGRNERTIDDLARQWAIGYAECDTGLMCPLLTANGLKQMRAEQDDPGHFFTGNNEPDPKLHRPLTRVTGYVLRHVSEYEVEVVYTEQGRGFTNHQGVQRLTFAAQESGGLYLDRWEDVAFVDGNDYLWYSRYCLPSLQNFERNKSRLTVGELASDEEVESFARWLAGITTHEYFEVETQSVTENVWVTDGAGFTEPGYRVVLRFTDGSGWLTVVVRPMTDADGGPFWNLASLSLTDYDPDSRN